MRQQLLGLFGLFLVIGIVLYGIDQVSQSYSQRSIAAMRDELRVGVRGVRHLSGAYGRDLVNLTVRTRRGQIDWEQAVGKVAGLQAEARRQWQALATLPEESGQVPQLAEALRARPVADAAVQQLRGILEQRDADALARFADQTLYPAIQPVTAGLELAAERGEARADRLLAEEQQRARWFGRVRLALALISLVLLVVLGRRILRNGYRGAESLTRLARAMAQHDYALQPGFVPRGELGEVMDSFLHMRERVQRVESDLTDQLARNERTRVALERREQFQHLLLESAPAAIFAVDQDGVFSQVSPFAEQLLGWPTGSLLGRETLDAVLDPGAVAALARSLGDAAGRPVAADWTVLRTLAQHREPPREFALRHRDGRALPVLLALSAMRDDVGALVGLLAVATDLTAIKHLEHALRESEARALDASEAKSAFLAAMSHEIRTPMIGVTGMIEVLAHTRLDPEQRRALNVVQASAETLLRIIGDILDFSKIEAGRMELEPVPTSLPELLRGVTANYLGSASSKGLALVCELDPQLALAYYVDPVRLRQVIGNFVSNAIKFTEAGGVTVGAELLAHDPDDGAMGADRLLLRVTDTGIGISAQAQARLFQPFSQAEADTTRRFGGTGLGLAISRRIADLMGARIRMDSAPGHGTRMQFEISLRRAPPEELPERVLPAHVDDVAAAHPPPTVDEAVQRGCLVLLVDDHGTNRQVIQRQLALAGYAAETAEDGVEGLERWRSGRFGLVLSDVHMPKMDGYQMARAIREEEAARGLPRTPIVALTASALKGEAERCLHAGMDDYLTKPAGIGTLRICMQRWLPHAVHDAPLPVAAAMGTESDQAAGAEAAPVLCADVLDALTGGNVADNRALIDDFLASTREDLAELERLAAPETLAGLTRQAHKMKGAARLIGALQLADAAAALEAAGRSEDWRAVPPKVLALHAACARLRERVEGEWLP